MSSRVRHIASVADILVLGPRRSQSWATATGPCTRNRHEPHRVVSFLFQRRSHHQRHDHGASTLAAGYPRGTHRSCATSMHDRKQLGCAFAPIKPGSLAPIATSMDRGTLLRIAIGAEHRIARTVSPAYGSLPRACRTTLLISSGSNPADTQNEKGPAWGAFSIWRRGRDHSGCALALRVAVAVRRRSAPHMAACRTTLSNSPGSNPADTQNEKGPAWGLFDLAEREGFEPSLGANLNTISNRALSTAQPPLPILQRPGVAGCWLDGRRHPVERGILHQDSTFRVSLPRSQNTVVSKWTSQCSGKS